jgi:hypothetical protein
VSGINRDVFSFLIGIGTAIALLLLVAAPWTDKWLGSQSGSNKKRGDVEQ